MHSSIFKFYEASKVRKDDVYGRINLDETIILDGMQAVIKSLQTKPIWKDCFRSVDMQRTMFRLSRSMINKNQGNQSLICCSIQLGSMFILLKYNET